MSKRNLDAVKAELAPYLVRHAEPDAAAIEANAFTTQELQDAVTQVVRDDFGCRYLLPADAEALQKAVQKRIRKVYPGIAIFVEPARGGGFSINFNNIDKA